jgi:hypothetical protein
MASFNQFGDGFTSRPKLMFDRRAAPGGGKRFGARHVVDTCTDAD